MIGVLAQGRMGNQMFQYAFGFIAAKKLNTTFFLYNPNSLHYFKLNPEFANNKELYKKYTKRKFFKRSCVPFPKLTSPNFNKEYYAWGVRKDLVSWPNQVGGNNFLLKELKDDVVYDGYFQSDKYFISYETEVKNMFALKEQYVNEFEAKKKSLSAKKYIAIHIRRTDYINYGGEELGGYNMTLPVEFYKKSLASINNLNEYNVVFVSDDIDFVKKEFGEHSNYYFESNSEIIDYQILLNADKLIIANSTFSWWAAWLNTKADLEVFAPKYFLGFKVNQYYPAGIEVEKWNWIDVNE